MPGLMDRPEESPERKRKIAVTSRDRGSQTIVVEQVSNRGLHCDVDQNCDHAKFEVIVIIGNLAKSLFLCGHHFREKRLTLAERGYEVREIGLWVGRVLGSQFLNRSWKLFERLTPHMK